MNTTDKKFYFVPLCYHLYGNPNDDVTMADVRAYATLRLVLFVHIAFERTMASRMGEKTIRILVVDSLKIEQSVSKFSDISIGISFLHLST